METFGIHYGLGTPHVGAQGYQLAVDVALRHIVGIYNRHLAYAGTHKHLGGIATYPAGSHNQHRSIAQALHRIEPEQTLRTVVPTLISRICGIIP